MLKANGHNDVAVLDGGIKKWRSEGRPITEDIPEFAAATFSAKQRHEMIADKAKVTKTWDVTDQVLVTGVYEVTFKNASHYGLDMFRAALASAPAGRPEQLTELSVDVHKGVTYYRGNKAHIYTLTLDRLEPGLRYYLIGDIEGHPAIAHSGVMKYCKGDVWLRAVRPDNWDPASIAAKLLPLTDEELVARAARAARAGACAVPATHSGRTSPRGRLLSVRMPRRCTCAGCRRAPRC